MIETLFTIVIILSCIIIGLLIFLWHQFSSTESKLVKLIEDRIRLNNINHDLDKLKPIVIEETKLDH